MEIVVVVAVDTADVVVDTAGVVVEKTAVVVVAVDSSFSDCPDIVSCCLGEPPDHSHAIS